MRVRLLFCLCVLLSTSLAQAGLITFTFAGLVSQDPLLDPNDPFAGSITSGTVFSGSYTFESNTPDGDASAEGGSYTPAGGTLGVTIGGNAFTASDTLNMGVGNDFAGSDFYTVFAQDATGPDTFTISVFLQDTDGTALAGPALLTNAPAFAAFEIRSLFLDGLIDGNQVQINGDLTSLACTSGCVPGGGTGRILPEPGTLALLAAAVAGLGFVRRRSVRRLHR